MEGDDTLSSESSGKRKLVLSEKEEAGMRRDPYDVLGVPRNSSDQEIKSAYRKLALRYHPDKNANDPKAADMFKEATFSYNILSDPAKRHQFDHAGFDAVEAENQDLDMDLSSLGSMNTMFAAPFSDEDVLRPLSGTTVVGIKVPMEDSVVLVSDGRQTDMETGQLINDNTIKLHVVLGRFIVGISGLCAYGERVLEGFSSHDIQVMVDSYNDLGMEFAVDAIAGTLPEEGYLPGLSFGALVVGISDLHPRLWKIEGRNQVHEAQYYSAVGSGSAPAMRRLSVYRPTISSLEAVDLGLHAIYSAALVRDPVSNISRTGGLVTVMILTRTNTFMILQTTVPYLQGTFFTLPSRRRHELISGALSVYNA